jgi:hypothetical protein
MKKRRKCENFVNFDGQNNDDNGPEENPNFAALGHDKMQRYFRFLLTLRNVWMIILFDDSRGWKFPGSSDRFNLYVELGLVTSPIWLKKPQLQQHRISSSTNSDYAKIMLELIRSTEKIKQRQRDQHHLNEGDSIKTKLFLPSDKTMWVFHGTQLQDTCVWTPYSVILLVPLFTVSF